MKAMKMTPGVSTRLHEELPEVELSAENLMTGITGRFLEYGITQLRRVSTDFKQAYLSAQDCIGQQAAIWELIPKKELALNYDGDHGFSKGLDAVTTRELGTLSECKTILNLRPSSFLQIVNFWGSLPGSRDFYDSVAKEIMKKYTAYSKS